MARMSQLISGGRMFQLHKCQGHKREHNKQEPNMNYKDREEEIVEREGPRNELHGVSIFAKSALSTQ